MLHRIQIFRNTCEATMQVKRAIEKAILHILHKLPINKEYMCLCWVSTLFWMICCLFFNCSKSSTTRPQSLYIAFPWVVPRCHVPVLLAMQWSVASRSAFHRRKEHLWIVFSFNHQNICMNFRVFALTHNMLFHFSLRSNRRSSARYKAV